MHTCLIKIKVMIFAISIFSALNLLGFHDTRHNGAGYSVIGRDDDRSDARSDSSNYPMGIPITIGHRADTPDTAERVIIGSRSVDSHTAIFERGARPESFCARLCACLCCLSPKR